MKELCYNIVVGNAASFVAGLNLLICFYIVYKMLRCPYKKLSAFVIIWCALIIYYSITYMALNYDWYYGGNSYEYDVSLAWSYLETSGNLTFLYGNIMVAFIIMSKKWELLNT